MIKVKEVSKNFEDFVALDNITCNISDGCIYGMVALTVQESQHF